MGVQYLCIAGDHQVLETSDLSSQSTPSAQEDTVSEIPSQRFSSSAPSIDPELLPFSPVSVDSQLPQPESSPFSNESGEQELPYLVRGDFPPGSEGLPFFDSFAISASAGDLEGQYVREIDLCMGLFASAAPCTLKLFRCDSDPSATTADASLHEASMIQPESTPAILDQIEDYDPEVQEVFGESQRRPNNTFRRLERPMERLSQLNGLGLIGTSARFNQLEFHDDSPETLLRHFDSRTCGILSVKNGANENPWRTVILSMVQDSPALYHAVASMSAFHYSRESPALKVVAIDHVRQSLKHLRRGTESGGMRVDIALAAHLALGFTESWDIQGRTGSQYLYGGQFLIKGTLVRLRRNQVSSSAIHKYHFLCKTWLYMDVLARLTSTVNEEDGDIKATANLWSQVVELVDANEIDPLLGCAGTLFPIIGHVANFVRRVRNADFHLGLDLIDEAVSLKKELESWAPPEELNKPEDKFCDIAHSLQTAEAYRLATLLYLHQTAPQIPSRNSEELAQKILETLATVPLDSSNVIVQIYPLLAAGCETSSEVSRDWVRKRWTSMSQRMQISNIDRCLQVVEEVWRRRDCDGQERSRSQSGQMSSTSISGPTPPTSRAPSNEKGNPNLQRRNRPMPGSIVRQASPRSNQEAILSPGMPEDISDSLDLDYVGNKFHNLMTSGRRLSTDRPMNGRSHRDFAERVQALSYERTIVGRHHWITVMKDWQWEGSSASFLAALIFLWILKLITLT